jgi:hypothetical protein
MIADMSHPLPRLTSASLASLDKTVFDRVVVSLDLASICRLAPTCKAINKRLSEPLEYLRNVLNNKAALFADELLKQHMDVLIHGFRSRPSPGRKANSEATSHAQIFNNSRIGALVQASSAGDMLKLILSNEKLDLSSPHWRNSLFTRMHNAQTSSAWSNANDALDTHAGLLRALWKAIQSSKGKPSSDLQKVVDAVWDFAKYDPAWLKSGDKPRLHDMLGELLRCQARLNKWSKSATENRFKQTLLDKAILKEDEWAEIFDKAMSDKKSSKSYLELFESGSNTSTPTRQEKKARHRSMPLPLVSASQAHKEAKPEAPMAPLDALKNLTEDFSKNLGGMGRKSTARIVAILDQACDPKALEGQAFQTIDALAGLLRAICTQIRSRRNLINYFQIAQFTLDIGLAYKSHLLQLILSVGKPETSKPWALMGELVRTLALGAPKLDLDVAVKPWMLKLGVAEQDWGRMLDTATKQLKSSASFLQLEIQLQELTADDQVRPTVELESESKSEPESDPDNDLQPIAPKPPESSVDAGTWPERKDENDELGPKRFDNCVMS